MFDIILRMILDTTKRIVDSSIGADKMSNFEVMNQKNILDLIIINRLEVLSDCFALQYERVNLFDTDSWVAVAYCWL